MNASPSPPSREKQQDAYVKLLLVLGPYSNAGDLKAIGPGETVLTRIGARVVRIDTSTEQDTVEALEQAAGLSCDAVILDPGSLEHYSGLTADAVERLDVPVIVVGGPQEEEQSRMATQRVVTPAATATISGGGSAAYEAAVEAASWYAWAARRPTQAADTGVPDHRIDEH